MVKINGMDKDVNGETLADYLSAAGYDFRRIAVEKNGSLIPKAQYAEVILADNDTVEIVSFVGGG